ncbi:MAG TPA: hypothetical protein VHN36_19405 [Ilumatobacteraceae bacterium]|nr:hypothetical protein [Ilumatobacteraceae bacterium]
MDDIGAVDVRAADDADRSRIWADLVTEFGPQRHHAGGSPLIASAGATTTIGTVANIAQTVATSTAFAIIPTTN